MKKEEPYELRLKMANMHDTFLEDLENAMKDENYIEASWLCYALIEQRITRMIEKHINKCPKKKRTKDKGPVGISTKIECLKKLTKIGYGAYKDVDKKLLNDLANWIKDRNKLMHGLVSIEHYKKYEKEFESLAKRGQPLVKQLYEEAKKVREWCRADNYFGKFPDITCRCNKYRCIVEEAESHV